MSLTRANTSGWVDKDLFTATQANHMDTEIIKAPDFVNGGSYTPSASVDVAGSGIRLMGSLRLNYATRTITRALRLSPDLFADETNWRGANHGEVGWCLVNLTNANPPPSWSIDLPNGQSISKLTVWIQPAGGHVGLPTLPTAVLKYRTIATGATTTVATCTDASATVVAYEAFHYLVATSIGHTIDTTSRRYYIETNAESGANYVAGLSFRDAAADVTFSDQNEW